MATNDDARLAAWRAAAEKSLRGKPVDSLTWQTPEGIPVKPLYTAADLAGPRSTPTRCRASRRSSAARSRRCTRSGRGRSASTPASRPPRSRTRSTAATSPRGGQGVSVAFDLATHRGYDSDHPRVVGDVGKAGVAIDSVEDMKILFDGIPLDKVSVSMTMNGAVLPVLAGYIVAAEEQGVRAGRSSPGPSRTTSSRSSWSATPTSTRRRRRCGSSPTSSGTRRSTCRSSTRSRSPATTCRRPGRRRRWSSRFTLADGKEYVRTALAAGMDVDDFAGRLSFFFAIGMNFYLEVAKLRAARLLWWRIMTGLRRRRSPKSMMLRTHCQTSGWSLTEQDPYNNVVRTADRGDGRGVRRHPVAAHQLVRRGDRAAHRLLGPHRPQHPAHHPGGDRTSAT